MKEIDERIEAISNLKDHYLVKAKISDHPYYKEFLESAVIMRELLNDKEFDVWCDEKMLLKQQGFIEKTFIQGAVETATARYFGQKFPSLFKTEAKIKPGTNKDVDCQFRDGGYIFNVEVKCADFGAKEAIDQMDAFKYLTVGRLDDRGEDAKAILTNLLNEALAKKGESEKSHVDIKNMDLTLKTFLTGAHDKFNPNADEKELNILLIGCDDEQDLQMWFYYLFADYGLFRPDSFASIKSYDLVDAIVLTNQYHKHRDFENKTIREAWTLDEGFNLIFYNPMARVEKEKAFEHFCSTLPNFTLDFWNYKVKGADDMTLQIAVWMTHFIKDFVEGKRGLRLFQNK